MNFTKLFYDLYVPSLIGQKREYRLLNEFELTAIKRDLECILVDAPLF